MDANHYDLVVIGSGPAGQKAAIAAAKLLRRVAVIDRRFMIGGSCVHSGTIPSKTLREAVLRLDGASREPNFRGRDFSPNGGISIRDLAFRVETIVARETSVIQAQFKRNGVAVYEGTAEFTGPHTVQISESATDRGLALHADSFLIACGTRPARAPGMWFDGEHIIDTDQLLSVKAVPKEVIVVGAGVVGLEYASLLATVGCEVTIIDERSTILDFVDREIVETLTYHLRRLGITLRFGEKATSFHINDARGRVFVELESGKKVQGQLLLYAAGRQANGDQLRLEAAGLRADERGRVAVERVFRTGAEHI